jgi:hypothetical protein
MLKAGEAKGAFMLAVSKEYAFANEGILLANTAVIWTAYFLEDSTPCHDHGTLLHNVRIHSLLIFPANNVSQR